MSASHDLDFADEHARHYNLLAENHRRQGGPWPMLAEKVKEIVDNNDNTGAAPLWLVDLASGPGEPAATIAMANPHNLRVLCTDLSGDMVQKATRVAASIDNLQTPVVADMEDLSSQFDDESVDVVTCCYGYMFPANKAKALAETARLLKPGGFLLATTFAVPKKIKLALKMDLPSKSDQQHPMSLATPGLLEGLVKRAGLRIDEVSAHGYDWRLGEDVDDLFQTIMFRSRSEFDARGDGSALWVEARKLFDDLYLDHFEQRGGGGYYWTKQPPEYKLLVARKPERR